MFCKCICFLQISLRPFAVFSSDSEFDRRGHFIFFCSFPHFIMSTLAVRLCTLGKTHYYVFFISSLISLLFLLSLVSFWGWLVCCHSFIFENFCFNNDWTFVMHSFAFLVLYSRFPCSFLYLSQQLIQYLQDILIKC